MSDNLLALLAAALLPTILLDLALRRLMPGRLSPGWRAVVLLVFLVVLLVPWPQLSAAQNIRGLTGDLSVGTLVMMAFYLLRNWLPDAFRRFDHELAFLAAGLVLTAAFFYPMSLGWGMTDPYAHGFYPTVLSALLLTVFCWAVLGRWYLSAALIALVFAGYAFDLLESNNLWDYLFDPALVGAALVVLAARWRQVVDAPWRRLFPQRFTIGTLVLIAMFLAFSVVLSRVNPEAFAEQFTVEDGFVEWVTSLTLFGTFCFSTHRLVTAHRLFDYRGKFILLLVAAVCLFGAGEEISWGQRVFGIETPVALAEHNAQKELNLHNLTFQWNGKEVKINRLVFGRGLALALMLYLLVLTPLYHRRPAVRRLVDAWAIPIPATHHVVAYLAVVGVVELLVDSSKRGEMTEFAGALVFMLNVVFAVNRHIYRPGSGANGAATRGLGRKAQSR
jgi:hypothetical protein